MISANIESNLFLKSVFGQTNTNHSFKSLSERCPTVEPFALNSLALMYGAISYFACIIETADLDFALSLTLR